MILEDVDTRYGLSFTIYKELVVGGEFDIEEIIIKKFKNKYCFEITLTDDLYIGSIKDYFSKVYKLDLKWSIKVVEESKLVLKSEYIGLNKLAEIIKVDEFNKIEYQCFEELSQIISEGLDEIHVYRRLDADNTVKYVISVVVLDTEYNDTTKWLINKYFTDRFRLVKYEEVIQDCVGTVKLAYIIDEEKQFDIIRTLIKLK